MEGVCLDAGQRISLKVCMVDPLEVPERVLAQLLDVVFLEQELVQLHLLLGEGVLDLLDPVVAEVEVLEGLHPSDGHEGDFSQQVSR